MYSTCEQLGSLLNEARERKYIALDTEFVWTDTYYPILGVVQASFDENNCFLIDVPDVADHSPFAELMSDAHITKVLHDAPQDLRILKDWCGAFPKNIFDTRAACGFAGLPSTISLMNMLMELFDVELSKTESRTDWLQRPLTEKQIEYAKDDVRHMPEAMNILAQKISEFGRLDWLCEDMLRLEDESQYADREPEKQFKRIRGANRLDREGLAVLRELAAWRELTCRAEDLARNRVVTDLELLAIAGIRPEDERGLFSLAGMRPGIARKRGNDFIDCIARGLASDPDTWPEPVIRKPDPKTLRNRINGIYETFVEKCEQEKIDPALVSSKTDIADIVRFYPENKKLVKPLLQGWRLEYAGNFLLEQITESE